MKKEIKNNENVKKTEAGKGTSEKKNNITEIVFILDRSGSMRNLAGDTIGGYNSFLAKQRQEKGKGKGQF